MLIHPTAVINPKAQISEDVEIGPYAVIEDNVKIGPRVKISANAHICRFTEIGEDCEIHMGAVIGHKPQDLSFKKKKSHLIIGKRNIIREYVTIHRGTNEDSATFIGDDNLIMCFAHIGHNSKLSNNIIIANASLLGGYVELENGAFLSAYVVVHQFVRIGAVAMIGGQGRVTRDVPPYMLMKGDSTIYSTNVVGLRRAGFTQEVRSNIKKAYKIIYRSNLNLSQAIDELQKRQFGEEVQRLVDFLKVDSKRGISRHI